MIFIGAALTILLSKEDAPSRTSNPQLSDMMEESPDTPPASIPDLSEGDDEEIDSAKALAEDLADASTTRPTKTGPSEIVSSGPAQDTSKVDKGGLTIGMDREISSATVLRGDIKRVGPDELAVDDEFTLQGDGTQENPYRPTWEYLYSAGDTYAPRLGKNEIPQRIALLDGKWINISGYTVFPLVSGKTKEMLVMLNQWDGCCIGVPPTPFDAIEVGLNEAVMRGPKHTITYGTITGRLKVDPYLIEDWLVGLYLLEEGTLQPGI
ncbi:MAG: hypothetical protein CMJ33_00745 [Phycisphaerae bacterium]|nr:hypothetical protein [Phycisphaerae bacterium]